MCTSLACVYAHLCMHVCVYEPALCVRVCVHFHAQGLRNTLTCYNYMVCAWQTHFIASVSRTIVLTKTSPFTVCTCRKQYTVCCTATNQSTRTWYLSSLWNVIEEYIWLIPLGTVILGLDSFTLDPSCLAQLMATSMMTSSQYLVIGLETLYHLANRRLIWWR